MPKWMDNSALPEDIDRPGLNGFSRSCEFPNRWISSRAIEFRAFAQGHAIVAVTRSVDEMSEDTVSSVLKQPTKPIRAYERSETLAVIRHKIDALAYAQAAGGLAPKGEIEYRRLCDELQVMMVATSIPK
jgi:hypothetical protein